MTAREISQVWHGGTSSLGLPAFRDVFSELLNATKSPQKPQKSHEYEDISTLIGLYLHSPAENEAAPILGIQGQGRLHGSCGAFEGRNSVADHCWSPNSN